jgi:hypothetical protein
MGMTNEKMQQAAESRKLRLSILALYYFSIDSEAISHIITNSN